MIYLTLLSRQVFFLLLSTGRCSTRTNINCERERQTERTVVARFGSETLQLYRPTFTTFTRYIYAALLIRLLIISIWMFLHKTWAIHTCIFSERCLFLLKLFHFFPLFWCWKNSMAPYNTYQLTNRNNSIHYVV